MRLPTSAIAIAVSLAAGPAAAQDTEVDLELVLAVDISGSMDYREHAAQRDGYISAFRHKDVLQAIREGINGRIAVTYVEWAGTGAQAVVVPWMLIDGPAAAEGFASALEAAPIREFSGTSISAALDFAAPLFDESGHLALRQVIDVSGDGPNNRGRPVLEAREGVLDRGITINGLPIVLGHVGGALSSDLLDVYYEDCVIGGPGAFIIAVDDIERLAEGIRRKLVLEIAGRVPEPRVWPASAEAPRIDCLIGEKRRFRWYEYGP